MIPKSHPRFESLTQRRLLVEGLRAGATSIEGLIAYGRGEAFDYLLGERTRSPAKKAIEAAASLMLLAEHPVISVNGNTSVLCPAELVGLSESVDAGLEINLFHRTDERVRAINDVLLNHGAKKVYGVAPDAELSGIESERRRVDGEGIYSADVVLVALEDGDRTEALVKSKKRVIAIDLNPLSRTAVAADITIVDNVVRAVPLLIETVERLRILEKDDLQDLINSFDNQQNLKNSISIILKDFMGDRKKKDST